MVEMGFQNINFGERHPLGDFEAMPNGEDIEEKHKKMWDDYKIFYNKYGKDKIENEYGKAVGCNRYYRCDNCVHRDDEIQDQSFRQLHGEFGKSENRSIRQTIIQLCICCWNAAGLFCDDADKRISKLKYLDEMLKKADVLIVEETHDDGDVDTIYIEQLYGKDWQFFRSTLSTASGGIMIMIRKTYAKHFQEVISETIEDGRVIAIQCIHEEISMIIIGVHLHATSNTNQGKIEILKKIRRWLYNFETDIVYILGDFNFVEKVEDRQSTTHGHIKGNICMVAKYWEEHFGNYVEHHQSNHTRYPSKFDVGNTSARLDRIYSNHTFEIEKLFDITTSTFGIFPDIFTSDHLGVGTKVKVKTHYKECTSIPHEIATSDLFKHYVEKRIEKHKFPTCIWARLEDIKDIFRLAAMDVKQNWELRGAKTSKEQIYWALKLLREDLSEQFGKAERCFKAAPMLKHDSWVKGMRLSDAHRREIRNILHEAVLKEKDEIIAENEELNTLPEYLKTSHKQNFMQKLAKCNPSKTKVGIEAVYDNNDDPILDKDQAMTFLGNYWGQKFEEPDIDRDAAKEFTSRWSNKLPEASWILGWFNFLTILMLMKKSSPGPDGIPYAAWACSFHVMIPLFIAYLVWINEGYVPPFFNIAFLWLLPKGENESGIYKPANTRPLSGANTDAKIFAMCLGHIFNCLINDWATQTQRGFISGRTMIKNVFEVECHSLRISQNRGNKAAIFLFDFAAAFPSIARCFIWIALEAIGLPKCVSEAIMALYKNNCHFIRTSSGLKYVFTALAGVRQGCPLSSLIFILVTDCINRCLGAFLGQKDLLRAYADDIAIVLENLWRSGAGLGDIFQTIGKISSLWLNKRKCICIPLFSFEREAFKTKIADQLSWCQEFALAEYGKYLGFFVGPKADEQQWLKVEKDILEVARVIKKLGLPKFHSIMMFNMFGISKVGFLAQLKTPSMKVIKNCKKAEKMILGGPGNWAPKNLQYFLKDQAHFSCQMKDVKSLCKATMLRTMLSTIPEWLDEASNFRNCCESDEANLQHMFPEWVKRSSIMQFKLQGNLFDKNNFLEFCNSDKKQFESLEEVNMLQKKLYKFILPKDLKFDLSSTLARRFALRKWFDECDNVRHANKIVAILQELSNKVPPCVLFSAINTFFNGWTTTARFQCNSQVCMLCLECDGNDSIEHYGTCPYMWRAFAQKFGVSCFPMCLERFFGLYAKSIEERMIYFCNMYAVRSATNLRRKKQVITSQEVLPKLLWEGHKTAALVHKEVRKLHKSMWDS